MDIEFATGTSLQFQLKQPMDQDDVRKLIEAESLKDPVALPSPKRGGGGNRPAALPGRRRPTTNEKWCAMPCSKR